MFNAAIPSGTKRDIKNGIHSFMNCWFHSSQTMAKAPNSTRGLAKQKSFKTWQSTCLVVPWATQNGDDYGRSVVTTHCRNSKPQQRNKRPMASWWLPASRPMPQVTQARHQLPNVCRQGQGDVKTGWETGIVMTLCAGAGRLRLMDKAPDQFDCLCFEELLE